LCLGVLAGAILCVLAASALAAPFSDGDFETPLDGPGRVYQAGAPFNIGPWRILTPSGATPGTGSVEHGTNPGEDGCQLNTSQISTYCIDLNGLTPGAIAQTFDTQPYATYTVSFWMSHNASLHTVTPTLTAYVNSGALAYDEAAPGSTLLY